MKEYHFSLGNSTDGPVGFCAVVKARDKQQALEALRAFVDANEEVEVSVADDKALVYFRVYFNSRAVSVDDIDIVEDETD